MTISLEVTGFREWLVSACNDMYKADNDDEGNNNAL